jgi:hypothetical protein
MNTDSGTLKRGTPWNYSLRVDSLAKGRLDASVSLVGARWIWPAAGIGALIAAVSGAGLAKAISGADVENPIAMGISTGVLGLVGLATAFIAVGSATYAARLHVDESGVLFGRRFFWTTKGAEAGLDHLGHVQCWSHSTGSGTYRNYSYHVCLHLLAPLPVICLHSQEYIPDLKGSYYGAIGLRTGMMSRQEALRSVLAKADEIAEFLSIEHRPNTA